MKPMGYLLAFALLASAASAQSISGTIQISRTLTHRSVTASVPLYQRGPTTRLGGAADADPIAFERSHVIVYLEAAPNAATPHSGAYSMQQLDRQFQPDLLVVPLGATVTFPNQDPIFHNVFSLSKPKSFDLGSYDKGETRNVTFTKPGIVSLYCHLHPNMAGTIFVAPTRWYARVDREGHFTLRDVPPGQYTVVAWHKAAGTFRQKIDVVHEHDTTINFVLPFIDGQPDPRSSNMTAHIGGDAQ